MHERFRDRTEAGQALARRLKSFKDDRPLILALPRGGVPVAYEVARALRAPLDTVVARKVGAPGNPEFGLGAVAPGGVCVLDERMMALTGVSRDMLEPVIAEETREMVRQADAYKSGAYAEGHPDTLILIDDGLATGVTARAAIESVRKTHAPRRLVFAAPVCAPDSAFALRGLADDVICLMEPEEFAAVGYWYESFPQTSDEEVIRLLETGA